MEIPGRSCRMTKRRRTKKSGIIASKKSIKNGMRMTKGLEAFTGVMALPETSYLIVTRGKKLSKRKPIKRHCCKKA
jgi:hypothetical protein